MKIVIFLACVAIAAASNLITVNSSTVCCGTVVNGVSIDDALGNISSGDYIQLQPGCHCVRAISVIRSVTNVSLVGVGKGPVNITCTPGIGLAFLNVTGLKLQGLTITGCGISGSNADPLYAVIKTLVNIDGQSPNYGIAVLIVNCRDVVMDSVLVTVTNTSGLSLVGINVAGESTFTNSVFSFQGEYRACTYLDSESAVGGGASFVFMDGPNFSSNDSIKLNIQNCTFSRNAFCGFRLLMVLLAYRYKLANFSATNPYVIGSGGGLSISFAQSSFGANVSVTQCVFDKNMVARGSAASVYWYVGLQNSHVKFEDCVFTGNGVDENFERNVGQGGIGLFKDVFVSPGYKQSSIPSCNLDRPNSLTVSRTRFLDNVGSGISIQSFYATPSSFLDTITVDSCHFEGNVNDAGPAIYAFESKIHGLGEGTSLLVQNCTIVNNTARDTKSAVLQALGMNITVKDCSFIDNTGTALGSITSVVTLQGKVEFINNAAPVAGGAMRLAQISFLLVKSHSSISFINNSASVYGGAMYADFTFGIVELEYNRNDCFLYFESINIFCEVFNNCPSLTDVKINMTFSNNKAPLGGTFYGAYFDYCPWASQLNISSNSTLLDTLWERSIIFHLDQRPNTSAVVSTPAKNLNAGSINAINGSSRVMPGEQFTVQVRALDLYDHAVPTVVTAASRGSPGELLPILGESGYLITATGSYLNASMRAYGRRGVTVNVTLNSLGDSDAHSPPITLTLTECQFGFVYDRATANCQCSRAANNSGVECDSKSKVFKTTSGWWFGPSANGAGVIYSRCPVGYCDQSVQLLQPGANQCADNRAGVLCGECEEGFSAVFGSSRCKRCSNSTLGLILVFAAAGVGLIAFITLFHFSVTDGYTYGLLLYANLGSIYSPYFRMLFGNRPEPFIPLQLLNLGLGYETCFYDGMTQLSRTGLGLVFPVYLFLLMILLIWFTNRSHRASEWLAGNSFTPSKLVATLIILSYNSITQSCFQILSFIQVTVYLEEKGSNTKAFLWAIDPNVAYCSLYHAVLFAVSMVFLAIYVLPLPILLILPTFTNRCVWKLKPLCDTFFSPFKEGRTFWIGLSLMLRVLLSAVSSFSMHYITEALLDMLLIVTIYFYVLFEPYKKSSQNAMYVFFFGNILTLVVLSLCLKLYQASPQHEDAVPVAIAFSTLASIVLGSGYLIVALVIIWKLYPKAQWAYSILQRCFERHRTLSEEREKAIPIETLTTTNPSGAAEVTKPKIQPPKFSELREPVMDEGYLNVEFKAKEP